MTGNCTATCTAALSQRSRLLQHWRSRLLAWKLVSRKSLHRKQQVERTLGLELVDAVLDCGVVVVQVLQASAAEGSRSEGHVRLSKGHDDCARTHHHDDLDAFSALYGNDARYGILRGGDCCLYRPKVYMTAARTSGHVRGQAAQRVLVRVPVLPRRIVTNQLLGAQLRASHDVSRYLNGNRRQP